MITKLLMITCTLHAFCIYIFCFSFLEMLLKTGQHICYCERVDQQNASLWNGLNLVLWEWIFHPTVKASFQISGQNLTHWLNIGNINTERFCSFLCLLCKIFSSACMAANQKLSLRSAPLINSCLAEFRGMNCRPAQTLINFFFLWSNQFENLHCKWMWSRAVNLDNHPDSLQGRKWHGP